MDIDIDTPRDRSAIPSANNSRASSVHLSISSISYIKGIEAQSNNFFWVDQVELNKLQELTLSYANFEVRENKSINKAIGSMNTLNSQRECVNSTNMNICFL